MAFVLLGGIMIKTIKHFCLNHLVVINAILIYFIVASIAFILLNKFGASNALVFGVSGVISAIYGSVTTHIIRNRGV